MIHIFGDSYSDCEWPHILTQKTGVKHINYSVKGQTNHFILTKLIENLEKFKKDDIIIIQTSGQGRINVKDGVVYGDEVNYEINELDYKDFTAEEWEIIRNWYKKFFLPQIIENDDHINSIIHLANHLSNDFKVVLWNLTSLGYMGTRKINDNVPTSPKIPYSDLWLPLSEGGSKGWLEIIVENGFEFSFGDPHPNKEGNIFIAEQIYQEIFYYI